MGKIITISRQFGSGGSEIGKKLAKKLEIPYYDKTIIDVTAKESGFDPKYIEKAEQSTTTSFLYNLAINGIYTQPLTDQLFAAECKVIRALADKGPCVIVGRCSDYVLKDEYDCLNVFVHSSDNFRINRVSGGEGISREVALDLIRQKDKARARHYKYYTEKVWGLACNYDICINTAACGIDEAVEIIARLVK